MRTVSTILLLMVGIVGCDAVQDQSNQPQHPIDSGQSSLREEPSPWIPACDPRTGRKGSTVITQGGIGLYQYHDVWCSVGRPTLPSGCYFGVYVRSQSLASMVCRKPVAGSCTDPVAEYDVTCNAVVDCIYDCDGDCNPVSC